MNMFTTLIRLPLNPMSIEIFEDAIEVLCCLGESIPLFGIVFQEIFVLELLGVLQPTSAQNGRGRRAHSGRGGGAAFRRPLRYSLRYIIRYL